MSISSYYQDKVLDQLAGDASHVSLHTADPGDQGISELVADAYERQRVLFDTPFSGSIQNSNILNFDDLPVVTITHFGLWDSKDGGRFLWGGLLVDPIGLRKAPMTVEHDGDTIRIPAGKLEVSID